MKRKHTSRLRNSQILNVDTPLFHSDHPRPVTRRQLLGQGFISSSMAFAAPSLLSLFANSAHSAVAGDVNDLNPGCALGARNISKLPVICIDLAGGANIAGSNVIAGGRGGQRDVLSASGYSKLGLPGDMIPDDSGTNIDSELGIDFHADSALLRGIKTTFTSDRSTTNGVLIPSRSDNDTANNPHNPMYGLARYALAQNGQFDPNNLGNWGQLMPLVGTQSSVSGGRSMAPTEMILSALQPTKISSPVDAKGLINTGSLNSLFDGDTNKSAQVLEAMTRLSDEKLKRITLLTDTNADTRLKDMLRCGYIKAADIAASFSSPNDLDPLMDPRIVGGNHNGTTYTPIFPDTFASSAMTRYTASIMKLVLEGRAGAGTISLGGYDYHTGNRSTGEQRDFNAGKAIGACLEYAARLSVPLMIYVFSDGAVSSDGTTDDSMNGRGKGNWSQDSSGCGASLMLVYDPTSKPELTSPGNQIGYMKRNGTVDTTSSPAANNVNLLVDTVVLNYMALHGDAGGFADIITNRLGDANRWIKFAPLNYNFS